MEKITLSCPACGASNQEEIKIINNGNSMIGICSHCNTKFLVNGLKEKTIIKKEEENKSVEEAKEITSEPNPELVAIKEKVIEFKDNVCATFKNPTFKRRAMAFAAAITMALTLSRVDIANQNEYVEPDREYVQMVIRDITDKVYNNQISDEEAYNALRVVGVRVNPKYFDILREQKDLDDRKDIVRGEAKQILINKKNGVITEDEAVRRFAALCNLLPSETVEKIIKEEAEKIQYEEEQEQIDEPLEPNVYYLHN